MTTRRGNRRIVVGIDGSPGSQLALEWAAAEAHRYGGEIDAVLVYGSGLAWIDVGSDAESLVVARSAEQAKQTLHDAIAASDLPSEADVRINPIVVLGEAWRALCDVAHAADLLVLGTRGRGGFAGLVLGSVSQRCAERSPCPVVVVPGAHPAARGATAGRRVVVGVDGSPHARRALEWAVDESEPGDEIDAVLVFDRGLSWILDEPVVEASVVAFATREALAAIHKEVAETAVRADGAAITPQAVSGPPWRALVETADDADLLVVGRRGRGGFAGLPLGSVSRRCAERSACPVVVVPTPDTEPEVPA